MTQTGDTLSRQSGRPVDPVVAERDFLLARALHADHTWVGRSSDEMVRMALEGCERPEEYPHDTGDLGRCEETYRRAPEHLQRRMLPTLELFRRMINPETGMVDGLWCFECDHGGYHCTWRNLCKEHAEAAGIDTRPIWERKPELFERRSGR